MRLMLEKTAMSEVGVGVGRLRLRGLWGRSECVLYRRRTGSWGVWGRI